MSHAVPGFNSGSTSCEECLELRDALEPLIESHAARYHRVRDIRDLNRNVKSMEAFSEFDGEAMVAVHRNLVKAIDAGEGPELDAATERTGRPRIGPRSRSSAHLAADRVRGMRPRRGG